MSPTTNSTTSTGDTATTSPASAANVTDPLANESTFLTLLVSQLKNQDPLNPTDSNQFVSQLTAYSQLEQLIGIHKNTSTIAAPAAAPTANSGTTTGTNSTPQTTGA